MGKLIHWLNQIPNKTYPDGINRYEAIKLQYQEDTFFGRGWSIAWWRQIWHMIGGVVLVFPFLAGPAWLMNMVPIAIAVVIMTKEVFDDSRGNVTVFNKKNLIDIVCWTLGATFLVVLVQ